MPLLFALALGSYLACLPSLSDYTGSNGDAQAPGDALQALDVTQSMEDAKMETGTRVDAAAQDSGPDAKATSRYALAVLADNPSAYFRLEDAQGVTALENEVPGSSVSATLGAAAVYGSQGISVSERAIRFGSGGPNLLLSGPVITGGTDAYSLESWVSFAVLPSNIINGRDAAGRGSTIFRFDDGTFHSENWRGTAGGDHLFYALTQTKIGVARWYHVVITYDPAADNEFLYIDGLVAQSGRINPSARVVPQAPVQWLFAGSIDEVAVYPTVLSPARIAAHMAARQAQ
jgi:Concanavalin A-like lectin/glucanases superfamily